MSPLALALGLAASALSSPGATRPGDDEIAARSVALQKEGRAALDAGRFEAADSALEAALVADPRNRLAYVDLARVAIRQQLYGQAIRLTRKALSLDPNDVRALAVQGEAMVQLGAAERARANLARIDKLCGKGCAESAALAGAIERGPSLAAARPADQPRKN